MFYSTFDRTVSGSTFRSTRVTGLYSRCDNFAQRPTTSVFILALFSMPQISIDSRGVSLSLHFTDTSFFVEPDKPHAHNIISCCTGIFNYFKDAQPTGIPLRNIISANSANGTVAVQYLARPTRRSHLMLATTHGTVKEEDKTRAKEWCQALSLAAYQGLSRLTASTYVLTLLY